MSQKQISMEQLKQILQLRDDGVGIREIARRLGISRNSVRKYLALLPSNSGELSPKELAEKAYPKDVLERDAERLAQLTKHILGSGAELSKTGVTRQLLWQELP